jgi:UMF1 family MFS transporter
VCIIAKGKYRRKHVVAASRKLGEDVAKREVFGWAMYDFANSGYTTVVITAVFNAYFVSVVAAKAAWATFAWTGALAIASLAVMATGPLIGAWADVHAAKKRLLALTTAGCVIGTVGLAWVGPGEWVLGIALVALATYFFGTGENLIAAFLPEIAKGEAIGRVSGWGWSLGYLGGLLVLGMCLAYVTWAQGQGQTAAQFVPVTMMITAGMFALASVPTFVWLRERAVRQPAAKSRPSAYGRVLHTLRHAGEHRDLRRFLLCLVFYQSGIQTVIALAAIYAEQALGFTTQDTIVLILVVNVTAAAGAFAFGEVQDRLGHVPTIALTLVGWIIMVAIAASTESRGPFWVAANLAGLCLGSSQSAGRALVGYLSPPARRAEFYGLWGLAVKLSAVLGPVTYGLVTWISGGNHRLAILGTGLFFVAGLLLLRGIDVNRGRLAAEP